MELRKYWEIILRRKWLFIQAFGVVAFTALIGSLVATPIYQFSAEILVKNTDLQTSLVSDLPANLGGLGYISSDEALATQLEVVKSDPVIDRTINLLNLKDNKGNKISKKKFVNRNIITLVTQGKGIRVEDIEDTEIIKVTGYSINQEEAVKIANTVSQVFLELNYQNNRREITRARAHIDSQLKQVNQALTLAEEAELKFRLAKEAVDLQSQTTSLLNLINDLTSALIDVKADLSGNLEELTAEHPQARNLARQVEVIGARIEECSAILKDIPNRELALNRLSRTVTTLEDRYNALASDLEVAKIAEGMDICNATIVAEAKLVDKEHLKQYKRFPQRKKIVVIASFLGLFLGLSLVFFSEYLDDSLWTAEEARKALNQKVIGIIPRLSRNLTAGPVATDSFWDLYSNIKLAGGGKMPKILSVASALPGEGRSTVVLKLAYVLSQAVGRTLIVDANLRRPTLHQSLKMNNSTGLTDLLEGKVEFEGKIQPTEIKGLDFLASGPLLQNPLKLIDSPQMARSMEWLKANYDAIIIDTPSFGEGSDSLVLSGYADGVIFLIEAAKTSRQRTKESLERFQSAKANILGIVLNKLRSIP